MDSSQPAVTKDEEHLRLLSIFHYVVAAMTAVFALFPIIHLVIGLAILSGEMDAPEGEPPPEAVGWIFVVFSGIWIVLGLTLAVLIALGGRALRRRRSYSFCLFVACAECLVIPFGTVLGVFTIIVLMRDSVKARFGRNAG